MSGIPVSDYFAFNQEKPSPTAGLEAKIGELISAYRGEDIDGGVSGSPIELGRQKLRGINKGIKGFAAEEVPAYYNYLAQGIGQGRIPKAEGIESYISAARGAGVTKGVYEKAGKLAELTEGVPQRESYERYKPYMQLATQQMLGRQMSQPEFQSYVGAMQGMGITNPNDVAASYGKMLSTSDEYTRRQYRFAPKGGMPTLNQAGTEAFQKMLNASIA